MKKQCFILGTLLITCGLCAARVDDLGKKIAAAQTQIYASSFGPRHNSTISLWNQAFADAKKFVMDNWNDLFGKKDATIADTLTSLEQINRDFTGALNTIRDTLPKSPISRLLPIATNAKNTYNKIYAADFTLGNKKDAKKILLQLARFFEEASKNLYNKLVIPGNLEKMAPQVPGQPAPYAPPAGLPPAFYPDKGKQPM